MKIMTFNLRIPSKVDGENIFEFRKPYVLDVVRNEMPDVIGFQEANDDMIAFLQENLPAYYFLGHGREKNYTGEAPLIAYRWEKFMLHGFTEEMLSFEPQKNGTRLEGVNQSRCPRAFAVAELVCKENHERFAFCNVHTDHMDQNAVFAECVILMQHIGRRALPFILTGDFNATPDSLAIQMINATSESLGTVDATANIKTSFHNYGRKDTDFKIDYIFTNLKTDPSESYAVPNPEGKYYSDHYALCAKIMLEK